LGDLLLSTKTQGEEMKPYGYVRKDGEGLFIYGEHQFQNAMGAELVPVYLHPKEWVGLTDDELLEIYGWRKAPMLSDFIVEEAKQELLGALRKVEAKLKEKNT
jgi:hypothetical protein